MEGLMRGFLKVALFLPLSFCFVCTVAGAPLGATEPIKIGTIFSITGWAGFLGTAQQEVFLAMIDDINSKGGIHGRPIELYYEDDKSNPMNAAIAVTKLVRDKKVVAVVGTSTVDSAMAIVPVCEQEKVPFINTGPARIPLKKWIFSVGPGGTKGAIHMLDYAVRELGAKRIALFHGTDGDGTLGAKAIDGEIGKYPGASVVIEETFEPSDTNMIPQLTKIKAVNPDVILLYTTGGPGSVVGKNYKQLGMTTPVVGFSALTIPDFVRNAGKVAEESKWIILGVPIVVAEKMAPNDPYRKNLYEPLKKLLQQKYGPTKNVTMFHGSSYDAINAITEAMKMATKIDPESIRDALEKVRIDGFIGAFAPTPTDHQGAPADPMIPIVLKDGEWIPYTK